MKLINFLKNKIHLIFLENELINLDEKINKEKEKSKKFKKLKKTNNSEEIEKLLLRKKEIKEEIDKIKT